MNETFKAIEDTWRTCVGVGGEPPHSHGNCFGVKAEDGTIYNIVNFYAENLDALVEAGLKFPLICKALGERTAILHDPRIGERWYSDRYCEICCPKSLLPITQRQVHERDIARGRREERGNLICYHLGTQAEFD